MNKLAKGVAVTVIALALPLAAAPSAFAAVNDNSCDVAESCVFLNSYYGGGMDDMSSTDSDWRNNYFSSGGSVHDAVSSGFGHNRAEEYWVDVNFSGAHFTLGVNQYDSLWTTNQPNASSSSYNFNDKCDSNALVIG